MFDQLKDMYKLQKQAKEMDKKLKNTHIQSENNGIEVIMNAKMEVVNITITDEALALGSVKLSKTLMEVLEKARKKAEEIAASVMKEIMGGSMPNIPGLTK
jgi:DNA-binding protein YbaB